MKKLKENQVSVNISFMLPMDEKKKFEEKVKKNNTTVSKVLREAVEKYK